MQSTPQSVEFWNTIFPEGESGYVAVALKLKSGPYKLDFIDLSQREKLDDLLKHKGKGDLYFCPSILKSQKLSKSEVKYSYVLWADQDASSNGVQLPPASLVVASGTTGHTHVYWRLSEPLTWSDVESRTRGIVNVAHADPSGIDVTQMLRIPGTLNHKDKKNPTPVEIVSTRQGTHDPDSFTCVSADYYDHQYSRLDVLSIYHKLDDKCRALLLQDPAKVKDRSEALMHLAYCMAESSLNDDERFTFLQEADDRWGKFSERDDRDLRLGEIVFRSSVGSVEDDLLPGKAANKLEGVGWRTLSSTQHQIKWVVERILPQKGLMFFTASSGVGKSTLAMNMAASLVLKDIWLDFKILERDQKIMYASTEMNEGDINYFLSHLNSVLPVEIQEKLDEQVIFYPEGTPIYLNTKEGQTWYEDRLEYNKPTGLIIDTLGASVSTSLTDEKEMRLIADWIDTIRNKLGIWVCILHHYRKASNQTRTGERTLDDMYGAQLIANRAQTVWGLRKMPKDPSILEVQSHKGRFTDTVHGRHMFLRRSSALWLDKDSAFSSKGKQSETVIEDDLGPSSEKDLEI